MYAYIMCIHISYTYVHIFACMHMCEYIAIICVNILRAYIYAYAYMYVPYVCMCMYAYVLMYVYMYVHMCVYIIYICNVYMNMLV